MNYLFLSESIKGFVIPKKYSFAPLDLFLYVLAIFLLGVLVGEVGIALIAF